MTASAVLNGARTTARISEATRSRVRAAAEQLGYRPNETARGLAYSRMNTIGILATLPHEEPNLYFLEVINGVVRGAAAEGQTTSIFTLAGWNDAERRIAGLCDGRIDGLILLAPMLRGDASAWLAPHTPVVSIHANGPIAGVENFESDEETGAFQAVSRMLALGHRRILHIGGPEGSTGADRRIQGYRRAHADARVTPAVDHLVRCAYTIAGGRMAMDAWLRRHRGDTLPHALFAGSDAIALGCVDVLTARGFRVPDDISVVGFDQTVLAQVSRLTTVRQPLQELGMRATASLVARIEAHRESRAGRPPCNTVLPTELAEGATLAPPPATARTIH